MNINQIEAALSDIFNEPLKDGEQRKIVFWVDKDNEFTEDIEHLNVDKVKVHTLTDRNQFQTKYLLEEEDPVSSYLIYTNTELGVEDNWLADTFFYSKTFYADRISLILSELNIDPSLRAVIKKYERFFNNKDRFRKFSALNIETYSEQIIELSIMSVLCNVKTPDFEEVLKAVLMDTLEGNENKYLFLMEKFFDIDVFWNYVSIHYGYEREKKSLKTLFIHLVVTAFSQLVGEENLNELNDFISNRNKTNAVVFIDHWMHHKTDYVVFDEYAKMIEQEIQLSNIINHLPFESFKQADTFPYIDRAIIIYIANGLVTQLEDYEEYTKLIKLRRAKHYYDKFASIYEALYYTVKIHEFYKEHRQGIPQGRAIDLYQAYVNDYHLMDTYYRKFYVAYDEESNHDLLKKLKMLVENLYTNWYMGELSSHWSQAVESEMTQDWSLPGIKNQQDFYSTFIDSKVRSGERVFVIVSDAMRYEIGVELAERLNTETMGVCDVETLLGVVPSVTKIGMSSLLPHNEIDIDTNARVFVDGKDSSGLENRKKIIESKVAESIGVHFQDVLAMNKAGRRETFKGKKLIYIYHDTIDAMGDKASTEVYTFNAVETSLNQLYDLVKIIRDDLSGTNVFITADHGFLYQRDELEESDKIGQDSIDRIEVKRRYILSKDQREVSGQLAINLSSIIKNEQQLTAYLPKATLRYKMQGSGINFVHGGASLQEIVVPLLSFKNKRTGQKGAKVIKKVDIKLTNTTRKITNSIFNLEFFQTEKVEDKITPRTVVIYMADEEGNVISNEETIIGDRPFDNPADRTFKIRFVLKSIPYDRNKTYYLTIKDTETGVVVEKIPFNIKLGIISDFDF
ncbi:BREX-1 system phosphatase PglZ type A [Bacillus paralicheniformis]|uniref:BREX-1 system phosphatase PglZ type A n=1 Tax=Bacillus paralicheniformis TaxID=1648923 RepID=UPI00224444C3|nr:BREX-1 system phosphatase PglZ type A [Bacillus paralicheniformis]MEC1023194.1 BREX-1 system phosphatase PglZ type A [Bacillus paralicheniformis]MEC1025760.1 BREX-1 system phosphatase PglZ type A [Bacillus paralicheniformis]MEC1035824.1 BREX-1 system phosphatase PglZ type A [Bacillus paralicheniformis]MEC1050038.1 BREX-1 system phosphatase PglZ type A [Bacillus paralicheniformis]MEC1060296.1 BREX-1 system phosphatase PglZ type A [Bacillus paralicheniformis]